MESRRLVVEPSHPALTGHFPGWPVTPGVVLLNMVFAELARLYPGARVSGIRRLKFLRPLLPGEPFHAEFSQEVGTGMRIVCYVGDDRLADMQLDVQGP